MNVHSERRAWTKLRNRGGWLSRAWDLGQSLRPADAADRLFILGTPTYEPWHVAAHLEEEARFTGLPALRPTLLRNHPPAGAPPHLAYTLDELASAARRHVILVVAPDEVTADGLQRLSDARRRGATVLAVTNPTTELANLANESVLINRIPEIDAYVHDFELASHLLAVSAGTD